MSVAKSQEPRSATTSTSSTAHARIRLSSRATALGVNALASSPRRREWSGGSWLSIICRTNRSARSSRGSSIWVAPRWEE
jgi:hypothetical protein